MGRFTRIRLGILVLAALAVSVLAFAGGTGEAGKTQGKAVDVAGKEIKLQLCTFYVDYPNVKTGIEKFEKDTGMKVVLNGVDWQQSALQLAIDVAAGNAPDVVMLGDWSVRGDIVNDRLYPLNKYISAKDIAETNKGFVDRFTRNGKLYGYIANTDVRLMFYNKAIFEKAGLPRDSFPETWTQFMDALAKLNHVNGKDQYAFGFIGTGIHFPIMWETFVRTNNGFAIDPDTGKFLLGSDATVKAAQLFKTILDKGYTSQAVFGSEEAELTSEFLGGNYAIILGGSWMQRVFIDGGFKPADLGYAKIPRADNGKFDTISGAWSLCITKGTQFPDQAFQLIDSVYSDDAFISDIRTNKSVPTRRKFFSESEGDPYLKWITQYSFDNGQAELHSKYFLEDIDVLTKTLQSAIGGKEDIKTIFDTVSTQTNAKHGIK
jgi:multiple sugar transport system substrate-binding protein